MGRFYDGLNLKVQETIQVWGQVSTFYKPVAQAIRIYHDKLARSQSLDYLKWIGKGLNEKGSHYPLLAVSTLATTN